MAVENINNLGMQIAVEGCQLKELDIELSMLKSNLVEGALLQILTTNTSI